MLSRQNISSDFPYHAHVSLGMALPLKASLAQTEVGKHVTCAAQRILSSSRVDPADIMLISLAAAAHPDALKGLALLWVDNSGEALTAFEPGTAYLWHKDPRWLSNSGREAAVVRFTDGRFSAVVGGEFITIDGDDALYKTLLTAVYQRGAGIVSAQEGEKLRRTLATLMLNHADRLGALWQDKNQWQPRWETHEGADMGQSDCLNASATQCYAALAARGEFTFVPRTTSRSRVLASLSGLTSQSLLALGHSVMLRDSTLRHAVAGNAPCQVRPMPSENKGLRLATNGNEETARPDVALPLIAAVAAPVAAIHPARSRTLLTAMGMLGLTSAIFVGKQLLAGYRGKGSHQPLEPNRHYADAHVYYSPSTDLQLENTNDAFFISSGNNVNMSLMSTDERINYRLTRFATGEVVPSTTRLTTQREHDDVSIEQLAISCVEERQQQSLADVLREIGQTLSYPVTELAKEAQVLLYYERYHQCPSEKDVEKLEFIASGIDTFISSFISLLPGAGPLSLVQRIGGPLFQLLADALDNKELDMNNVEAVNDQILFLARTTWDFTPRERNGDVKHEEITLPAKTLFKKNKLSALINRDYFRLTPDGPHYIGRSRYSTRPVTYSPSQGEWVFREKNAYLYEENYHKSMVNTYRVSGSYIHQIKKHPGTHQDISIDGNNDIMHVVTNDNSVARFVLMDNGKAKCNVESEFYRINGVDYGYARKDGMEDRLIRFNNNAFYFEARSAKINKALSDAMSDGALRRAPSDEFYVTSIMQDGFSYDNENKKYLKYNNGYYRVETNEDDCAYINCLRNDEYEKVYIKKNKEGFFDVDEGFSWESLSKRFVTASEESFIERDIANEIHKNCVVYVGDNLKKVDVGIFYNGDAGFFFSLHGKAYEIVEHRKDTITLKSKYPHADDITLFMTKDYFFELKAKSLLEEGGFVDITASCKIKRTPSAASCDSVMISQRADNLLRRKAKTAAIDLGAEAQELRIISLFPSVFFNAKSQKLYFKHDGRFYKADFKKGLEINALRQITLHVYYNGVWGSRKNIVSLVFDNIDGKTVIQTQEEKLQWRADMTDRESIDFVRDNDFLKIPDFGKLEDVVADVNRKNAIKYVKLPNNLVAGNIIEWTKVVFSYQDYDFKIYPLDAVFDDEPLYVRGGVISVKSAMERAHGQIDIAIKELKGFTPNAQKYISYVLGVEDVGILRDFSSQLVSRFIRIKGKINKNNIKLVSRNREPIAIDGFERDTVRDSDTLLNKPEDEAYYHQAALPERIRTSGVYAFVPHDAMRNIYICLDRFHFIDPTHPDASIRNSHYLDITETIIHEATHSADVDFDITYISIDDSKLAPVLDAIDEYRETIAQHELNNRDAFISIRQEYMKLHPEYSTLAENMQDSDSMLNYLFSHDIGFKANVLLSTPDFLAIFARDLPLNSAVKLRAR